MTLYHVTASKYDGGDLVAFAHQFELTGETVEMIAERWPEVDPSDYYFGDGLFVHCHETLGEAIDFRDEFAPNGEVLEIFVGGLDVGVGAEYPHPVIRYSVPADRVKRTN